MRLIDADALIKTLNEEKVPYNADVNYFIERAPTIAPVKRGKWLIKDNPGIGWYQVTCSECDENVTSTVPVIGFFPNAKVIWDFCPWCGARMDSDG